ncbi:MAG: hypothetical protein AB7L41_09420, partial [Flavobacteriaceae bacterium]
MDFATIVGILSGIVIVGIAIFLGGDVMGFVDVPAIFSVVGGTVAATVFRYPSSHVATALVTGGKVAFTHRKTQPRALIDEITELADIIRKRGPL